MRAIQDAARRQVESQGAFFAARDTAAVAFADFDDEGVEFVVVAGEGRGRFRRLAGLRRKGLLGKRLEVGVLCVFRKQAMAGDDAAEVFVDDHGRGVEGVEQDGIGGFGSDARQGEQLVANGMRRAAGRGAKDFHGAAVVGVEEGHERFEGRGLAQHKARGADEGAQFGFGNRTQPGDVQDAVRLEAGDGALDAGPGGVLGKVRADDDFEGGFRGPPLLRPKALDEAVVEGAQAEGSFGCGGVVGLRRFPGGFRHFLFDLRISVVRRIVLPGSLLLSAGRVRG